MVATIVGMVRVIAMTKELKKHFGIVILLCIFLMAGCSNTSPEVDPTMGGVTKSFVSGMGCDDPTCTDTSHHHDCLLNCTEYEHYHHCDLDCTDPAHNHHNGGYAGSSHHSDHK